MAQTPDPDGNQDGQRDLDAEFAALMDDVEIPDDLSAVDDLEAPEGTAAGRTGTARMRMAPPQSPIRSRQVLRE